MKHELPPLPYDYNALEPYYDEATVRIHHDKHQAAYVAGWNKAEEELEKARIAGDYSLIQNWERQLAFQSSGAILHALFWQSMSKHGGGEPKGSLLEQIKKDFGSFENFKKQFSAAALAVEGSGWALLGWMPSLGKLYILQVENHQKLTMWDIRPILALDVWEHAYYLKFQNRRADWIESWWNIVNWENASKMLNYEL
ncbi:MAG: superoxide dismutase [Armatimonadetes bacterium]|nr:superoxide dismutase [Armatimonadota bacterium]